MILARSPGRRSSQGKGKGLRDDVLLGKAIASSSGNESLTPESQAPQQHDDDDGIRVDRVDPLAGPLSISLTEGHSVAGTHAFPVSAKSIQSLRSPLRPRQPSIRNADGTPFKNGQSKTDLPSSRPAAAIFPNNDFSNRYGLGAEPELPPTPTQLGLSSKPGRPRGLAASSSPSAGGSRRTRLRSGHGELSSPLKSKMRVPSATTEEVLREDTDATSSEEAPESAIEQTDAGGHPEAGADDSRNDSEVLEGIIAKRRVRDDLSTQLARLEAETARLEHALHQGEEAEDEPDPALLDLISTPNISCDPKYTDVGKRQSLIALKDPIALDVSPLAYLRAFAPGDLHLTTTTKSSSVRGKIHQIHTVNCSAPPPWPPHVFIATFRGSCEVEGKRIISITGANIRPRHGAGIKELRHWMEARLKNPLHKFDVGTLVWGLGMWWKEAVARAQFFHHIDITKVTKATDAQVAYLPNEAVKAVDVQNLLPYLGKSFVELIAAEPYSNRASTNEARKYKQPRLLLKWDLELDWAGEVHTEIDVTGTKVSSQGQEGLKKVFSELVRRNGLDEAVRQIVQICGGAVGAGKRKRKMK